MNRESAKLEVIKISTKRHGHTQTNKKAEYTLQNTSALARKL